MKKLNTLKIIKTIIGCCISLIIASQFDLQFSSSVIIITLLSVQNTKKDTLIVALKRVFAFCTALLLACILFPVFQYSILGLGVFLLVFITACELLQITVGLTMSIVLMLHLWNAQTIRVPLVLNECYLMLIGIMMGILMNLYMPSLIRTIKKDQRAIEDDIKKILLDMSNQIVHKPSDTSIEHALEELKSTLDIALKRTHDYDNNTLTTDMSYYISYMQMRKKQYRLLVRINECLSRITTDSEQARDISVLFQKFSESLHEYNNAAKQLEELLHVRKRFKASNLPTTREEFEARAILYEIVHNVYDLILIKKDFTESLTEAQVKKFWKA